ncbi:2-hydroxyacyl-CoA dehydratase [Treponema sp. OMZ 787]|uniref:double-cubane-cluster-containing anaerobic reductase n=1 Tax=Treponema sp. OMZ 787 TaxID=2563669 RepID=UPI0020A5834B|nr:double-cubane-cluster-containing anaerobic reductase [Treponema sp. OMZ 787]UTC62520.1 2-hydroxyacyl-CoA dehydratase [Treponema sp. OMZ 787]
MNDLPKGFDSLAEAQQKKFIALKNLKDAGGKVIGLYCSYVPTELVYAAGAVPVSLCATSEKPISAAERDLPKNFCPLIKASYGHAITDTCPFFYFSDFIVGETTCDGKKKMFELLNDIKPTHVMHLPQNNLDPKAYPFWADEVKKLKERIEEFYNITITEDDLRKAIKDCNQERRNLVNFFELSALDPSPVSGLEQFNVKEAFGFQYDINQKNAEIVKRTEELKEYWEKNLKGTKDERPRILVTGCPLGGVKEKILAQIEKLGAVIVGYDSCSGLRTHMEFVDEDPLRDPIEAIAEKYLKTNCSVMSPNPGRLKDLDYLIDHYKADAVIECTLVACHTFNLEAHTIGKYVMQKGLPYIHIESDYSQEDAGQFATRLEAFLEVVSERKKLK